MSEEKKAPLQTFKEGAATIKLWENKVEDRSFVTASIGKLYKDEKSGQWRETKSFNSRDLENLQKILPESMRELENWREYYNLTNNPEPEKEAQPEKNEALAKRDALLAEKQQTMAEARDAVMDQVSREASVNTQEHAKEQSQNRDYSR
jgi:hypothetical protein